MTTRPSAVKKEFHATFALGMHLVYSRFNDQTLIHMIECAVTGDPIRMMKTGLYFTPSRLRALTNKIKQIDEMLRQRSTIRIPKIYRVNREDVVYKAHVGTGVYVSVDKKFNGVDLRRHYVPDGQISVVPTKEGIYMLTSQWNSFKQSLNDLLYAHPELINAEECFHEISLDVIDCKECLPFGLLYL